MNKRIRLLAEQATTRIEPTATSGEGWIFDKEKFAELIVKECVTIANRQFSAATGLDDRDCLTAQQMKQHFGVEE